jgi:hypothetical protein
MPVNETKELARALGQKFASGDNSMIKEGSVQVDRFIRRYFKELSFGDKIIEPEKIGPDDLYPMLNTDKPHVMFELEPECPAAHTYAFNAPAPMMTMGIKRVLTAIDRIQSVRLQKEVIELLGHSIRLEDVNGDYQLKEIQRRFDIRFLSCINRSVGSAPGQVMAPTGSVHYHQVPGGLSLNNFAESMKYIPLLGHENGLNTKTVLMNMVTYKECLKWGFLQAGPDISTDIIKNGLSAVENGIMGVNFVVSIKRDLIPDGAVYHFADPRYIGRTMVWSEPTLHVKQMDHSVEFYVSCERGGGVYVFGGLARVDYLGVA